MHKIFTATVVWSILLVTQTTLAKGPTLVWSGGSGVIENMRNFRTGTMPITGVIMKKYPTKENRAEEGPSPNLQISIKNGAFCSPKIDLLESLELMNLIASGKDVKVTCYSHEKAVENALDKSDLEDCFDVGLGNEITPASGSGCYLPFPGVVSFDIEIVLPSQ